MDISSQNKANRIFLMLLTCILIINLGVSAYFALPDDFLFLITSDAMEYFITAGIGIAMVYLILPQEDLKTKILAIIGFLVLLFLLAYLKAFRREFVNLPYIVDQFFTFLGLAFFFYSIIYFFKNLRYFVSNTLHKTEIALAEAEYQLSRQQFDPHFMFNMFNSLYSMSLQKHPQLSDTILKMSNLMRYITDKGEHLKVPISDEFNFIKEYVALQKVRFGENAEIRFEVEGEYSDLLIAPLLLMTPIENAFKHGYYVNDDHSYMRITVVVDNSNLSFSIKNSINLKQHFQERGRIGKGLDHLRKRLKLTYPHQHNLVIQEDEKQFMVNLKINLDEKL